jgi:trk system potassium uptake protein TrkA
MKKETKKIAVIGLGSFGSSLALELVEQGAEVVAIDIVPELVNNISNTVKTAICFDCTNEALLMGYGVANVDLAVVAIGANFGSNVIITKILKDNRVTVHSRANSDREEKILNAVGADMVYRPEHEQGITSARAITFTGVKEYVRLSANMEIIVIAPHKSMIGKKIIDLDIRRSYGVNIAFFGKAKPDGTQEYRIPNPQDTLCEGDLLWLIGANKDIRKFQDK